MKPLWIELVNTGVANRLEFEDHELIEINWRLTGYPKLYHSVYQHELNHEEGNSNTKDLAHDMTSKTPGLFKFMRNHISSWTQIFPIYWSRRHRRIMYDWSNIVSWWLLIGTALAMYIIIGWVGWFL